MRLSTLSLSLVLLAACGPRPGRPDQALFPLGGGGDFARVTDLEVRWEHDETWRPVETLRDQPAGRGDRNVLHARFTLPQTAWVDPAIYVSTCVYLRSVTIGPRTVETQSCVVPVLASEAGQRVELRFESSQHMREGQILIVSQLALRRYLARTEAGALWVAFALLIGGAFLALLASRGGAEALTLSCASAFCLGIGVQFLQQTNTAEALVPIPAPVLRGVRDVAVFVFPAAFVAFVGLALPSRPRILFAMARAMGAALGLALLLQLLGVLSMRVSSRAAPALALAMIVVTLVTLLRHRSDPAARRLLFGLTASALFSLPDILYGSVGLQLIPQNTAHWGALPLLGAMALVVQDRFRAGALAMEQRLIHIERLNEELRHQVEARSRELGAALASLPPPTPREAVTGEIIDGRYRVEGLLGKGGMAQVYRVTRLRDGQPFALKLLQGTVTRVDAARFAREAELAARLRHPNLVPVVDVGLVTNGPIFLVMELVEGSTLAQLHGRYGETEWAWRLLADIARGLARVHEAGVMHRDLKPSNVMVTGDTARLTDFGVARPDADAPTPHGLDDTASRTDAPRDGNLTRTGAIVGTPRYMAPEVARGEGATRASDVFALGLLAFEIFTGRYPMAEPPYVAILARRPLERVVSEATLPLPLRATLVAMLAEHPAQRPTAAGVLAALERTAAPPSASG